MIDPVVDAGTVAEVLGQWLPHLTAALRLGTAGLAFGIAVHRTARYIRRTRNPRRKRRRRRSVLVTSKSRSASPPLPARVSRRPCRTAGLLDAAGWGHGERK